MAAQPATTDRTSAGKRSKLMLLAAAGRPEMAAEAQRIAKLAEQSADVLRGDLDAGTDLGEVDFDVAVVVGGDGSLLRAAQQMGRNQRPLVGVNLGKLGFLADLSPADFQDQLPAICGSNLSVVEHLMFECRVLRGEKTLHEHVGLNEVAVLAGPPFSILDVDLYVDAELVTTYSCDGLIISTPVGSTAHSLSAGGPILRQDLQAFVILPISPHTLTNRPVVDSADRVFEMVVPRPHEGTSIVADGRVLCKVQPNDRVRVERSDSKLKRVALPGHSYYKTLREKLGWGGRLNTKSS